ncbi:MAG: polyprenol monophosphomannose synthase [Acidobacteriota bacterium]
MNVLVIIPTYNERENLPALARQILDAFPYRVLVVDDHSPDGTGDLADQLAGEYPGRLDVLHRTGERGLGRSYVDGFRWALATDADLICQMDADFSHDPRYLPDLVNAADTYDLVQGSRYLNGVSVVNWPLRRIILSVFANWYVRTITGLTVHDVTGGYRCWRREALQRLRPERILSRRYAFMVESVFEAARLGLRIGESPIIFVERRVGASKMSGAVLAESMVFPWRLVWRNRGRIRAPREAGRS